jgi:hypothetical protein
MISESSFNRLYNDEKLSTAFGISLAITIYYLIANIIDILEKGMWNWWFIIAIPLMSFIGFYFVYFLTNIVFLIGSFISLFTIQYLNIEEYKKAVKRYNSPDYHWNIYLHDINWGYEKEAETEMKAIEERKISWQNIRMFSFPMLIGNFEANDDDPIIVYDEVYINSDHPNKVGFVIISPGDYKVFQFLKNEWALNHK